MTSYSEREKVSMRELVDYYSTKASERGKLNRCYESTMLDVYEYARSMNWWTICNKIAKTLET